jgi:SAM-dependent methyltransferase
VNEQTRGRLNAINRAFYDHSASEFGATRNHAWPGWERVLASLPSGKLRVLDVGCGNARLAAFLGEHGAAPVDYLGVDSSAALLAAASGVDCAHVDAAFELRDLLAPEFQLSPPPGPYDLIAVFGLLHHVPSFDARVALLHGLGVLLAPQGVLAVTLWRFAASDRFSNHLLDWHAYNDGISEPVDLGQLERGDHLVRWGADDDVPRYCHDCDEAESEQLIAALRGDALAPGLHLGQRFRSDGRSGDLNDYLLFSPEGAT